MRVSILAVCVHSAACLHEGFVCFVCVCFSFAGFLQHLTHMHDLNHRFLAACLWLMVTIFFQYVIKCAACSLLQTDKFTWRSFISYCHLIFCLDGFFPLVRSFLGRKRTSGLPILLSLKESVELPVGHPIPSRYGQIRIITPPFKPNDHSVGLPDKINSTSGQRREYPTV